MIAKAGRLCNGNNGIKWKPKGVKTSDILIFAGNIAQGSLEKSRYYLILSKDLNYGDNLQLKNQLEEVSKLLQAYLTSILNSDS